MADSYDTTPPRIVGLVEFVYNEECIVNENHELRRKVVKFVSLHFVMP